MRCPICEGTTHIYEKTVQKDNVRTDIRICSRCLILFDPKAYDFLNETLSIQEAQHAEYLEVKAPNPSEIKENIDRVSSNLLEPFFEKNKFDADGKVFCDFGCGRGYSALAACKYFDQVLAVDINHNNLEQVMSGTTRSSNLVMVSDINNISDANIDLFFAWHSIEHVPYPSRFFPIIYRKIKPGGHIYFQVPLFRKEYITRHHYIFYNEASLRKLIPDFGFNIISISFDIKNSFVTVCGRRE